MHVFLLTELEMKMDAILNSGIKSILNRLPLTVCRAPYHTR